MCRANSDEEALRCAEESWERIRHDLDLLIRGMRDDLDISEKRELMRDYDYSTEKTMTDEEIDEYVDEDRCYEWFWEYGLALDVVEPCTFRDQPERFVRYQISYGGPQEEIRFYYDCGATIPNYIEFWFLDWGVGNSIDISQDTVAEWLWDNFSDILHDEIQNCNDYCEAYEGCDREYIPDECKDEEYDEDEEWD